MSLKCKGCGIELQDKDYNLVGYVLNLDQDYCQRCYRLSHYGDISSYKHLNYNKSLKDLFNLHSKDLFILIVDCYESLILDKESFLDDFKDKNIVLIVNKIDLLPRNITENKIVEIYEGLFIKLKKKYPNLLDMIITHKSDSSFSELFLNMIEELNFKTILFIGKVNAGKSTILNKLFNNNDLTTSIYPGTTVDSIEIEYESYRFIDTPGIDDSDNILTYLPIEKLDSYIKYKNIKPLVFQAYENQSYYMSNIFRLDILTKDECSIVFESFRDDIHRTKYDNRNEFESKNKFEFSIKPWSSCEYIVDRKQTFLIKGFGLIRIKGKCKCNFMINDKIKVYIIEDLL